ncbi:GntR family transcriptional regulator [Aquibacillus sp. 3ASR75-54]|uniref:GntR family transcriptional regulator n=1 Tax=Aquibacillus salsiterrae TaxID=2950439 RepID=A0A9X3WFP2_9BACI|nr:GntR family transcriptional regulator [Aquibacillus salsiterrae]MDC3417576.1 GntR family transcriptional regulator [Aquibacillus salsiterrae]
MTNRRFNGQVGEFVYQTLKEQIIKCELEPARKISEKEIAERLNVSRSPVREAFLKLEQEDLLGIYPQSGTIVSKIDLAILEEGRFVRENIEKAVVREACDIFDNNALFQLETNITMQELCLNKGTFKRLFELDEEFHKLIFQGCNKFKTWKMVRQMNSHFDRLRILKLSSKTNWDTVYEQHKAIYKAIIDKNKEAAERAMSNHLKLVIVEKDELKSIYPDYFN